MEWRPAEWSVCLPLLIFPCTIKSRSSLLAPAHPGGPGKRAVKRLWCDGCACYHGEQFACEVHWPVLVCSVLWISLDWYLFDSLYWRFFIICICIASVGKKMLYFHFYMALRSVRRFQLSEHSIVWCVIDCYGTGSQCIWFLFVPLVGPGHPFASFLPLFIHFLIFCSFLLFPFSFSHLLYLFSSFVHPFPFYQNSPTLFPRPDVVGSDRTWI